MSAVALSDRSLVDTADPDRDSSSTAQLIMVTEAYAPSNGSLVVRLKVAQRIGVVAVAEPKRSGLAMAADRVLIAVVRDGQRSSDGAEQRAEGGSDDGTTELGHDLPLDKTLGGNDVSAGAYRRSLGPDQVNLGSP